MNNIIKEDEIKRTEQAEIVCDVKPNPPRCCINTIPMKLSAFGSMGFFPLYVRCEICQTIYCLKDFEHDTSKEETAGE